jgi:hypothetical protein
MVLRRQCVCVDDVNFVFVSIFILRFASYPDLQSGLGFFQIKNAFCLCVQVGNIGSRAFESDILCSHSPELVFKRRFGCRNSERRNVL